MIQEILKPEVFAKRREKLLEKLPANSLVALFSADIHMRNQGSDFAFRQDSYFWYFTGFPEDKAVALFVKTENKTEYLLFCKTKNPNLELWSGKIIGQKEAQEVYLADAAYAYEEFDKFWANKETEFENIFLILEPEEKENSKLKDLKPIISEMRKIKAAEELELIAEAGRISSFGHIAAMQVAKAGAFEFTLQAAIEAEFRRHKGCEAAFMTIAASGLNSCCLHYSKNNAPLKDGDLVLIDAGAEYCGYAGDISRTFPVNGKFSKEQEALYEVVLNAQKEAIKNCVVGVKHQDIHNQTAISLMQGLIDLNVITGDAKEWVESNRYKRFYPHSTGHFLGLDTHDVGAYKIEGESISYQNGMVITVEPGIYLLADDLTIAENWRGLGIRIEDDLIISENSPELTTLDAPKEVKEIENLMAGR